MPNNKRRKTGKEKRKKRGGEKAKGKRRGEGKLEILLSTHARTSKAVIGIRNESWSSGRLVNNVLDS